MEIKNKFYRILEDNTITNGNSFSFIKFIYGLILFLIALRYLVYGWWKKYFVEPDFHFRYPYFEWIPTIPDDYVLWVFVLLAIFSLFVSFGIFYKWSLLFSLILFSLVFFQDVTYYLNHHYFILVMGLLFLFLPEPQHNFFSAKNQYYQWGIYVIRIQIAIVYFYAGFAKIQPDWLIHGLPLKIWLARKTFIPEFILTLEEQALLFSWAGMLFDITIPLWLSLKSTRKYAYFFVIIFHVLTRILFEIGVFPWIMILFTTIYFEPNWPYVIKQKLINKKLDLFRQKERILNNKRYLLSKVLVYTMLVFQILFPLRFIIYLNDLSIKEYMNKVLWQENAFRWSWRVMLVQKSGYVKFFIHDKKNNLISEHDPLTVLSPMQYDMMAYQPDLICQYANYLKQRNGNDVNIYIENYVSWNGKPSKQFIKSDVPVSNSHCPINDFY